MNAYEKITAYGSEFGVDNLNVDTLISSHRSMREAIRSDQKLWLEVLEGVRQRAYQQVLDTTWIRIEDLKKMSVQELAELVSED